MRLWKTMLVSISLALVLCCQSIACSLTVSITFPGAGLKFKKDTHVVITGTVTGNTNPTTITIFIDNAQKPNPCQADSNGKWRYVSWDTSGGTQRGNHTIRADAKDSLDRTGSASRSTKIFAMCWPRVDTVTNEYEGPYPDHCGIDIDSDPSPNDNVIAVEDGTISARLGDGVTSYGWYRTISYGTVYARLTDAYTDPPTYDTPSVSVLYAHLVGNTSPSAGDIYYEDWVGDADCTGNCQGDHLHFEVKEDLSTVDPRDYLP